jgi:hypothetical protein
MARKATAEEKEVQIRAITEERMLARALPEIQTANELKILNLVNLPVRFSHANWDGIFN